MILSNDDFENFDIDDFTAVTILIFILMTFPEQGEQNEKVLEVCEVGVGYQTTGSFSNLKGWGVVSF